MGYSTPSDSGQGPQRTLGLRPSGSISKGMAKSATITIVRSGADPAHPNHLNITIASAVKKGFLGAEKRNLNYWLDADQHVGADFAPHATLDVEIQRYLISAGVVHAAQLAQQQQAAQAAATPVAQVQAQPQQQWSQQAAQPQPQQQWSQQPAQPQPQQQWSQQPAQPQPQQQQWEQQPAQPGPPKQWGQQ